jgi:hypothetical protein
VKVAEMQAHIASLLKEHSVKETIFFENVPKSGLYGFAAPTLREVQLAPVRGRPSYLVALHEIGHVLGPWQSRGTLYMEAGAWKWAKANHPSWGKTEDHFMWRGLLSYLNEALGICVDRKRRGLVVPKLPPDNHPFWKYLPEHALSTAKSILKEEGVI